MMAEGCFVQPTEAGGVVSALSAAVVSSPQRMVSLWRSWASRAWQKLPFLSGEACVGPDGHKLDVALYGSQGTIRTC